MTSIQSPGNPIDEEVPGAAVIEDRTWAGLSSPWTLFRCLVLAAAAWFLLKELAPILRPLLLAILLAYVILPVRIYVKGQARAGLVHLLLLGAVAGGLLLLLLATYHDIVDLSRDIPALNQRAQTMVEHGRQTVEQRFPWLMGGVVGTASAEDQLAARLRESLEGVVNFTAGASLEVIQIVFFLVLILIEAPRVPQRVREAFPDEKAERILVMIRNANEAIAQYLKVKVKANLVLALPAMLVLWGFGVRYVLLWGVLTFVANFIPYLGSLIACGLPILFAFLTLPLGWQPIALALALVAVHGLSAYLVEPAMTGKAVNLSPLVVLLALSFWSLCWGVTGMILAVPLTMMFKIILQSAPSTRPLALLMEE